MADPEVPAQDEAEDDSMTGKVKRGWKKVVKALRDDSSDETDQARKDVVEPVVNHGAIKDSLDKVKARRRLYNEVDNQTKE